MDEIEETQEADDTHHETASIELGDETDDRHISSPASPCSSYLTHSIVSGWFGALRTKVYRPQLTPLACPHPKRSHDGGAGCLQCPPEEM